jgi:hypothetical protein
MVLYQADSPSSICDGSLDAAARMVGRLSIYWRLIRFSRPRVHIHMPLKQTYPRVYAHRLDFGPRVAHCPEATHKSASSVLPSPLPTRMSLHHFTPSHPLSRLMYRASAVSSLKRQAWGIRQALCALFPHPTKCMYLSHPMLLVCRDAGRWT